MTLRAKLILAQSPLAVALLLLGVRVRWRDPPAGSPGAADPGRQLPQRAGGPAHEGRARAPRTRDALVVLAGHGGGAQADIAAQRARRSTASWPPRRATSPRPASGRPPATCAPPGPPTEPACRRTSRWATAPARDGFYFDRLQPAVPPCRGAGGPDPGHQSGRHGPQGRSRRQARRPLRAAGDPGDGPGSGQRPAVVDVADARMLRPLGVVAAAVRRFGDNDLKARAAVRGAGRDRGRWPASSTAWRIGLERYRAELTGRAAAGRSRPPRPPSTACPIPCLLLDADGGAARGQRGRDAPAGRSIPTARRPTSTRAPIPACARSSIGCARTSSAARAPTSRKGFEEAVRVADTPDGERILLPRGDAHLRRGGRRRGRGDRAPGRDAPVPLRRAEERPGRDRRARVPDAADVAAHGAAPVHGRRRRAAHGQAGATCCSRRATTASACRSSSTSC